MEKLLQAREIINSVDRQMAQLFQKRMEAAKLVAEYKKQRGLPILDKAREEEIIANNLEYISDEEIKTYYAGFIRETMKLSRSYQHRLVKGANIAYSGVEGAFANIAAKRIFPDGNPSSYPDFKKAYDSVVKGECECVVLPVENSYAGEVGQVIDLIFSGPLYVSGMFDLEIYQNLLGVNGAKASDIKTVMSHPQALMQCEEYIKNHGFNKKEETNTAAAAKMVSEMCDISVAAIASEETAELYGLDIIERKINESGNNTTRFAVLTATQNTSATDDNTHTMILFTVKNEAGALAKAINVIGKYGYNMTALRSRPMKELMWEYYFYIEIEGKASNDMTFELKRYCDRLKVAGTYKNNKAVKVKK